MTHGERPNHARRFPNVDAEMRHHLAYVHRPTQAIKRCTKHRQKSLMKSTTDNHVVEAQTVQAVQQHHMAHIQSNILTAEGRKCDEIQHFLILRNFDSSIWFSDEASPYKRYAKYGHNKLVV